MVRIRRDICRGCGMCADVCPSEAITMRDGKAFIDGSRCTECGQCEAACPLGAVVRVTRAGLEDLRRRLEATREALAGISKRLDRLESRQAR